MGFFDNIGKAISDAGNTVIQKGKDVASTAKYNSMISEQEKACAKLFEQIGRNYYQDHQDDMDNEYIELTSQVKDAKEKIAEYEETIRILQGVSKCTNCGENVPNGSSFCPKCGTKVEVPEVKVVVPEEKELVCKVCGKPLEPDQLYCASCGSKVQKDDTTSQIVEAEEPVITSYDAPDSEEADTEE